MQSVFPQGIAYSARSGMPLQALQISPQSPKIVVWAVGATRQPACVWPPTEWQPEVVLDLNYSADSPGKQYAQRCGAHYYGGLAFFTAQAEAQRQFWQRDLPPR
jgi:shikimate 5-dehydrogenase